MYVNLIGCHFTVAPSSVTIENVTQENRLLGTEGQDLNVSCKSVGGKPVFTIALIIDGQTVASQSQSVQHTLTTINISYDRKTVACQARYTDDILDSLTD